MLNWDKILEILIGIILVTTTLTLSLDLYMDVNESSKREQKKLLANDVAYSYKLNDATHNNGVSSSNSRDRNGNGIPDYLEKGNVEKPDTGNNGPVQPAKQCVNIYELLIEYNSLVDKLPIEISTYTKYTYLGYEQLNGQDRTDLQNFLETYSYNINAIYCITVLADNHGPYKYLIEEVDPNVVTISYQDGDYLTYEQVIQLYNLAMSNFEISLLSLSNQTHKQLRDATSVNTTAINNIGFKPGDWAKIKIFKTSYKVDRVELTEVDLSTVPGDILDPEGPESPEAPEDPELENPDKYPDIDWAKVCVGDLQKYMQFSTQELGVANTNKVPSLIYNKGTRILTSTDLVNYYDYLDGTTTSLSIMSQNGYTVVNSKSHLQTLVDSSKVYYFKQMANEDGSITLRAEPMRYIPPTNVNGATLSKSQVESYMYNNVDINFMYETIDGTTYNKDAQTAWSSYLQTTSSTDTFYTKYTVDNQGNLKYTIVHSKQERVSPYSSRSLLSYEELKSLINEDKYNIRIGMLNGVSIDFKGGSPSNNAPNFLLDYLQGNISSSVFELSPRFKSSTSSEIVGFVLTETDTLSMVNLPPGSDWTKASNYGYKHLMNQYYIDKGYFKCN